MGILAEVHPHPRLSIVANPTGPVFDHPTTSDDPQASLRAELLGQLVAAQFDLENTLAELNRSDAPADAVRSSLQTLGDLQRQVGTASPAFLNLLRSEIVAGAASAHATAQQ